ncbi:RES family NAD+ phosphorylase [Massilia aquatica]|uniref:RES family NAD+ phosphorylase n=1 Tax=Massilia aquatica TaxID=2609000 RepID=UPI00141FE4A1|nr:RES family NAD+ phosphorylase [Massilia aquatica]
MRRSGSVWRPLECDRHASALCATSVALCVVEKFVHVERTPLPPLALVAVDVPDHHTVYEPGITALPAGWDDLPTSGTAQVFGGAWLASRASLAMKVPSAIVKEECNVIINPLHPDYGDVQLSVIRPFTFDSRMFK